MSFNITPVASGYQEIHPYSAMNIDSAKINTSLIMMKEWSILPSKTNVMHKPSNWSEFITERPTSEPFIQVPNNGSNGYCYCTPKNCSDVVQVDPMLATAGSALRAIRVLQVTLSNYTWHCNLFSIARILQDSGVSTSRILFLNLVCAPEGLKAMAEAYPEIEVCQVFLNKVVFIIENCRFYAIIE